MQGMYVTNHLERRVGIIKKKAPKNASALPSPSMQVNQSFVSFEFSRKLIIFSSAWQG